MSGGSGPRVVSEGELYTSSPYEPELPPVESLDEVDLTDPDLYLRGDPHATYKLLRDEAPVFWHKKGGVGTEGKGFWAVSTYEEAQTLLRADHVFSNARSAFIDVSADGWGADMIMNNMDSPRHGQFRRLLQRFFTPKGVEQWRERIRVRTNEVLDEVAERGECDFATDVAARIPFEATCALVNLAPEDSRHLATALHGIDYNDPAAFGAYSAKVLEVFVEMVGSWRSDGSDSILEALMTASIDGEPMSNEERAWYLWLLFTGGLDTTAFAASGGLLSFFHHPEQLDRLRRHPELMSSAVEEILRWTATSHFNKRFVTEDYQLGGQQLRAGDYIAVLMPSANRDATAYPDPFRFDVGRPTRPHIATFGDGPHLCLGAHFTRLELVVLFEELLKRFSDIKLAGKPQRSGAFTLTLSPLAHLPIHVKAA